MKTQVVKRTPDANQVALHNSGPLFWGPGCDPADVAAYERRHLENVARGQLPFLVGEHIEPFPKPAPPQPKWPPMKQPAPTPAPAPIKNVASFHGGFVLRLLARFKRAIGFFPR